MPLPSRAVLPLAPTAARTQKLTGTTNQQSTELTTGKFATLIADIDVYIEFGSSAPTASASSEAWWPAGLRLDWSVDTGSSFVAVFPKDGSSTFIATIWESSV